MGRHLTKNLSLTAVTGLSLLLTACPKAATTASVAGAVKNLYIASGQCYSGSGITTFSAQTSSRSISKLNLSSNQLSKVIDLSNPYAGGVFGQDSGVQSILDTGSSLLMLTENSVAMSDRKIFSIPKASPFNTSIYAQDPLALTQVASDITRSMVLDTDGALLFSKSIGIEKIGINTLRVPQGASPWVNAPAAPCATSTTLISSVVVLPVMTGASYGKIIYAHAGATAASNRLGIISADGYSVAANCLNGYQTNIAHTWATNVTDGPAATPAFAATGSSPTAMVFVQTGTAPGIVGKLIVAYSASVAAEVSNNTNANYALVAWDVTETSATVATLTSPVVLSRRLDAVFGVSALAYDATDKSLYVATASQTGTMNQTLAGYGYKVEKFTYDSTANTLTLVRPNGLPFLNYSSATKCITGMAVGSE